MAVRSWPKRYSAKVVSLPTAGRISAEFARRSVSIGLCHGCFDIIHSGHVYHLERACERAGVLFVSVTASRFVEKGPRRPVFSDEARLSVLAAMSVVDYVILSEDVTAESVIRTLRPSFYFKGPDYENSCDPRLRMEVAALEQVGGVMVVTDSGIVDSSSRALEMLRDRESGR